MKLEIHNFTKDLDVHACVGRGFGLNDIKAHKL